MEKSVHVVRRLSCLIFTENLAIDCNFFTSHCSVELKCKQDDLVYSVNTQALYSQYNW